MESLSKVKSVFIDCIDHIIKNNKLSHAYLIELNNYDEDLGYVYTFVKMILCNLSYLEVLSSSNPIIHQIDSNNYPDIKVVSSDNNVINKSLIIDLQKEFSNKSLLNGKRIYLIKEAEKLNGYSANTILKFLEEPNDDIVAILLTDCRYHVLDTILSRCQILSLLDEKNNMEFDDFTMDYLDCIIHPNTFFIKYNYYIKELFVDKNVVRQHLLVIENIFVNYLENVNKIESYIFKLLSNVDKNMIINIISIIEEELPKLSYNVNFKLWCDSFFSKLIGG